MTCVIGPEPEPAVRASLTKSSVQGSSAFILVGHGRMGEPWAAEPNTGSRWSDT